MSGLPILTLLTLLPLVGGLIVFIVGRQFPKVVRPLTIGFSLLALGFSILLIQAYDPADPEPQFVERASWIPQLGAEYHTGVDGLSTSLILLTVWGSAGRPCRARQSATSTSADPNVPAELFMPTARAWSPYANS